MDGLAEERNQFQEHVKASHGLCCVAPLVRSRKWDSGKVNEGFSVEPSSMPLSRVGLWKSGGRFFSRTFIHAPFENGAPLGIFEHQCL